MIGVFAIRRETVELTTCLNPYSKHILHYTLPLTVESFKAFDRHIGITSVTTETDATEQKKNCLARQNQTTGYKEHKEEEDAGTVLTIQSINK